MNPALRSEIRWFAQAARAPRIRPIRQWAEEEFILPEGKFEHTKFRAVTNPWTGLWLDEIDSGHWNRFILTANVQGGKTLVGFVMPLLWHLFEWKEPALAGLPTGEMASAKWRKELEPAILANPKWRHLVPTSGKGSKGGESTTYTFSHGPDLQFLTGHGGDEKRSGITSRICAVTEADRVDVAGEASSEAAPIFQMEARLASYELDSRFYAECTTTTAQGFVAREVAAGSASKIVGPCPHCGDWVSPEREHLVGWESAANELEAAELGVWICPHCASIISERARRLMNEASCLVHRGQTIDRHGDRHGPRPPTRTLGFRASAFHNLMWPTAFIASEEWRARRNKDPESAERKMRQWYWTLPIEPNEFDVTPLTTDEILSTQIESLTRGVVPAGTIRLSGAADVRKRQIHFVVIAWVVGEGRSVRGQIIDIGVVPVESDRLGTKKALRLALRKLRDDRIDPGYRERGGKQHLVGWFAIDSAWFPGSVHAFVRESKELGTPRYIPSYGRGLSAAHSRNRYQHPTEETENKPHIGDEYYIAWHEKRGNHVIIANADDWKGVVREGFKTPAGEPGALALFEATTEDEIKLQQQFAREVAAERAVEKIVPERGLVTVFVNDSRTPNHLGDATYNACITGHLCGVRIAEAEPVVAAAIARREAAPLMTTPDGRPYFITAREA